MGPAELLSERIRGLTVGRADQVVVAIDGRSGAGKSTLAKSLAGMLDAVVIEGDDFYAGGDGLFWDAKTAAEKVAYGIDWARQRPVLIDLSNRRPADWYPFDWDAFDGSLSTTPLRTEPALWFPVTAST